MTVVITSVKVVIVRIEQITSVGDWILYCLYMLPANLLWNIIKLFNDLCSSTGHISPLMVVHDTNFRILVGISRSVLILLYVAFGDIVKIRQVKQKISKT